MEATRRPERVVPPPTALARAHAVLVTRAENAGGVLAAAIEGAHGRPPIAWSRHAWRGLEIHGPGGVRREPIEWLAGRRVVTLLGVGHPGAVRRQIEKAGAVIVRDDRARDHERYRAGKVHAAAAAARASDGLFVTPKDWVKVRGLLDSTTRWAPVIVPTLALEVFEGEQALLDLVSEVVGRPAPATEPLGGTS